MVPCCADVVPHSHADPQIALLVRVLTGVSPGNQNDLEWRDRDLSRRAPPHRWWRAGISVAIRVGAVRNGAGGGCGGPLARLARGRAIRLAVNPSSPQISCPCIAQASNFMLFERLRRDSALFADDDARHDQRPAPTRHRPHRGTRRTAQRTRRPLVSPCRLGHDRADADRRRVSSFVVGQQTGDSPVLRAVGRFFPDPAPTASTSGPPRTPRASVATPSTRNTASRAGRTRSINHHALHHGPVHLHRRRVLNSDDLSAIRINAYDCAGNVTSVLRPGD